MTAEIIHVDFRTRKVLRVESELERVIAAITVPVSTVAAPRDRFLEPERHVYGSQYEATKGLPVKDIAKVVRAYAHETYSLMKFSVRSDHNSLAINVTNPGPVAVYSQDRKRYSDTMTEILNDVQAFADQFNFDDSDSMTDYFHTRMYVTVGVHYLAESEART